jgi:hypothetical protein
MPKSDASTLPAGQLDAWAGEPRLDRWYEQVEQTGCCAVRLHGQIHYIDTQTGEAMEIHSTNEPDGVRCGPALEASAARPDHGVPALRRTDGPCAKGMPSRAGKQSRSDRRTGSDLCLWWAGTGSNRRPCGFQPHALPTELPARAVRDSGDESQAVPTGFEPATSALTGRRAQPSCSTGPGRPNLTCPQRSSNPRRHLERVVS